ncbi:MAG: PHP domain-containing protein [Candidatus Phytoplasma stylosanthis]|nr:PHP domain-containing protein [Candidatus Phytoplasma stylosanthis]
MKGIFYIQSYYSLLESIPSLEALVKKSKENDYDFLALSDSQNLYGMLEFVFLCKKYNIKPILGIKIFLSLEFISPKAGNIGLLVYAFNDLGIHHLVKISNLINTGKKKIFLEQLKQLQEGLFFILSNLDLVFCDIYKKDLIKLIFQKLKLTFNVFFFGFSLQSDYLEMFDDIFLSEIIKELEILVIPVHKTNFLESNQKDSHQLLLKLFHSYQNKKGISFQFLNKTDLENKYNFYYKDQKYKDLFLNLSDFISRIEYHNFSFQDLKFPVFKQIKEKDSFSYLKQISFDSFKKKISVLDPKFSLYRERLKKELKIIKDMKFEDYFLIVTDLIYFAKQKNIFLGPGRGSSASSLVCFFLGITEVDPLIYNLLFERFLNPKRNKKPDIDLDFPNNKIHIILEYIFEKYGVNYTANIVTFSTLKNKSFVKNVNYINYLNKNLFLKNPNSEQMKIISKLEGMPYFKRNHPTGVVISNKDLLQNIPVQLNLDNSSPFKYQTQFKSEYLEKIGLLKIDLLSLKSLYLIETILEEINKKKEKKINWRKIPLDDYKTYQLLHECETDYIFQLDSITAQKVFI